MADDHSSSYDSDESLESSSEEEQQDISELSFAELAKIRKIDTTGHRSSEAKRSKQVLEEFTSKKKVKRDKDAPVEKSSKVYVSRRQVVVPNTTRQKSRDPRFEGQSLTEEERTQFRHRYGFIDEMQKEELKELKSAIRKEKDEEEVEKLKYAKSVMESRQRAEHEMDLRRQVKQEHNREQRARAEQGRQTYFLKDQDIDKRVQIKKFEELQKRGNIDRILAKKRKRVASKERKATPFKRRKLHEDADDE